jgi:hypothetical protein
VISLARQRRPRRAHRRRHHHRPGDAQPNDEPTKLLKAVREFDSYLRANAGRIPHYGERRRAGEAISTAFTESAVNQVISKRIWSKNSRYAGPHKVPTCYFRSAPESSTTNSPTTSTAGTPDSPTRPQKRTHWAISCWPRNSHGLPRSRPPCPGLLKLRLAANSTCSASARGDAYGAELSGSGRWMMRWIVERPTLYSSARDTSPSSSARTRPWRPSRRPLFFRIGHHGINPLGNPIHGPAPQEPQTEIMILKRPWVTRLGVTGISLPPDRPV